MADSAQQKEGKGAEKCTSDASFSDVAVAFGK